MEQVTKTYVAFKGRFMEDYSIREVSSRDIQRLEIPVGTVSFGFFDKTTVTLTDGRMFESEPFNASPTFSVKAQEESFGRPL